MIRRLLIAAFILLLSSPALAQAPAAPPALSCEDGRAALASLYESASARARLAEERAAVLDGQLAKERAALAKLAEAEKAKQASPKPEATPKPEAK